MSKHIFIAGCLAALLAATGGLAQSKSDDARNTGRILNGDKIDGVVRQAQWAMSLRIDGRHNCGASFIAPIMSGGKVIGWNSAATEPKWAITAAHCVTTRDGKMLDPARLSTFSGILNIETAGADGKGEVQQVRQVFLPDGKDGAPKYNPFTLDHDIAVLQLSDPGTTTGIKRGSIRLPTIADTTWVFDPYTALHTAGWGRTSEGGVGSPDLLEVRVPLVDRETCQAAYAPFNDTIATGMLCAGYRSGEFDSCQGDSGGPLYYRPTSLAELTQNAVLVGIVSWGRGCGNANLFGIYTNMASYSDWVAKVIAGNS